MSTRTLVLAGAAIVLLSGAAAFVGARLAQRDAPPAPSAPVGGGVDLAALETVERRLDNIERRLNLNEEIARQALDLARSNAERALVAPAPAAPADAGGREPAKAFDGEKPKPEEAVADDGAGGQASAIQKIAHTNARNGVVHTMRLFADSSKEGAANRIAQANAETQALLFRFGLKGEDAEDGIRKALHDQWEFGARDIGPLVRDGVEKADVTTVKDRLRKIHSDTDQKLRPYFDDATWKLYTESAAGSRASMESILDEFEKARLSGK